MAGGVGDVCKQVRSLAEIQTKPELEAILKRWDENLKLIQSSIESKRARVQAAKHEMYLLISFYVAFQGGVVNMLASKANAQKCGYALFPALLSTVALVAILVSVHDKFHDYHKMKKKRETDESESTRLQYNINMLLRKGGTFEFEDFESEATSAVEEDMATSTESTGTPSQPMDKWILEERRYLDVMGFLFAVFVIVLLNSIFVC